MAIVDALAYLASVRDSLTAAQVSTANARTSLEDARVCRCDELAALLADCQCQAERLAFVVEGDLRAELDDGQVVTK